MTFVQGAERCWRLAATVLGWGPDQFWSATPAELARSLPCDLADDGGVSTAELEVLTTRFPDAGGQ